MCSELAEIFKVPGNGIVGAPKELLTPLQFIPATIPPKKSGDTNSHPKNKDQK